MLRFLYWVILRLHPKQFREHFHEEMLSIFDWVQERPARAELLVDGFVSLIRQWVLRSNYCDTESLADAAPADGVPIFYTVDNFQPRTSALIHGAALAFVAFCGVCLVFGYNWTHPVLIPFAGMQASQEAGPKPATNSSTPAMFPLRPIPHKQELKPRGARVIPEKAWSSVFQKLPFAKANHLQPTLKTYIASQQPASPYSVSPEKPQAIPGYKLMSIAVAKNVELEVLDWGGMGRPLVLLAGLGNTAHVFDRFAPKLVPTFHVYGVTRRGFGSSSTPPDTDGNYSADRLADDVLAVVDSLRLTRPVLVGHSIAGEELSSIGTRFPDKVGGLVYLDAGYSYAFYDRAQGDLILDSLELRRNLKQFVQGDHREREQLVRGLLATLPQFERELRTYQKDLEFLPSFGKTDFPVAAVVEGEQKYTHIGCPILAVFAYPHDIGQLLHDHPGARARMEASDTAMTRSQINAFEKGVPSARVVRVPNASHFIFESNEAEVIREIKAFATTLP